MYLLILFMNFHCLKIKVSLWIKDETSLGEAETSQYCTKV